MWFVEKLKSSVTEIPANKVNATKLKFEFLCSTSIWILISFLFIFFPAELWGKIWEKLNSWGINSWLQQIWHPGVETDVGALVSSAAGLINVDHSAYEPLKFLFPLIGGNWELEQGNTHLPFEVLLFIPILFVSHLIWPTFWALSNPLLLGWTFRAMGFNRLVSYGLGIFIFLLPVSYYGARSTYVLAAFALAIAWRTRDYRKIPGVAVAFLAITRGFSGLVLVWWILQKRWLAFFVFLGVVAGLAFAVWLLDREVYVDFIEYGMQWIAFTEMRSDNLSIFTFLGILGLPKWLIALVICSILILGIYLNRSLFWLLVWASFALTTIIWGWTILATIPLLGYLWKLSVFGRISVIVISSIAVLLFPHFGGPSWTISMVICGVALIASPRNKQVQVSL